MEALLNLFSRSFTFLSTINGFDLIDIIIVTFLIYRVILFVRKTNSYNLAKGILFLLGVLLLSEIFNLNMINYILRKAVELGLIALVILFQPELRRLLERFGSSFGTVKGTEGSEADAAISQVSLACHDMSASKTGALLIFERKVSLTDIISTGTIVNADVNAELIKNLFFNKAPLHDGAVIIRNGRVTAAGCVLPLTKSTNLSKDLGMRHRAGIGLSEQSDAVVIIVSEETGGISCAMDGMLKRHLTVENLEKILRSELIVPETMVKKSFIDSLRSVLKGNIDEK